MDNRSSNLFIKTGNDRGKKRFDNTEKPDLLSVVAFDLATGQNAPLVSADREILELDTVSLSETIASFRQSKSVAVRVSDSTPLPFVAAIVWDRDPEGYPYFPIPFSTDDVSGFLPGSISVNPTGKGTGGAALAVLVPGAQGLLALPVRSRPRSVSFSIRPLGLLSFPSPSDQSLPVPYAVSVEESCCSEPQLKLPFRISHDIPWLKLESTEGTTPATLNAVVDSS